jgi:hypothetical protein
VKRALHFVGFRNDRYLTAVRAFGPPDFIHRGWDLRAQREIASGDTVVFAEGGPEQPPRRMSYNDLDE